MILKKIKEKREFLGVHLVINPERIILRKGAVIESINDVLKTFLI